MNHMPRQITYRPSPERMALIEERAAAKGLSLNDWLDRAVTFALTAQARGQTLTTTTTHRL